MEVFLNTLSRKGKTMSSDPSMRIEERPKSQSSLSQAPGQGQSFEDVGSSFGPKVKTKIPKKSMRRIHSDESEDEMDLFGSSQTGEDVDVDLTRNAKGKAKVKPKPKASQGGEWTADGKFEARYDKPKFPDFKKTKNIASTSNSTPLSSESKPKPNASMAASMRPRTRSGPTLPSNSTPASVDTEKTRPKPRKLPPKARASAAGRKSPLHNQSPNRVAPVPVPVPPRPKPRPVQKPGPAKFPLPPPSPTTHHDTDPESPPPTPRPKKIRGKPGPAPFPMEGMSPLVDRDSDKRSVQPSSSFPELPPLYSPPKPPEAFPHISPLSSPARHDVEKHKVPRPFPLASQVLKSMKRLSEEIEDVDIGVRGGKKRKDDDDIDMQPINYADVSQGDAFLFLDPSIDPSTLCPYCDDPLPATPTPHLLALLASTRAKSYKDPRPTNPTGLKAPLSTFITVCQRHRFESVRLPEAERRGWPQVIRFEDVRGRVEAMRERLEAIILDGAESGGVSEEEESEGRVRGPRGMSVFWVEMMKEVKKKGSRAVVGVSGQFASFEKTQPGYYGELGSVIIHQTLYGLFPPSSFDPTLIAPLTPTEFIQRILVPEAAVGLILEDRNLDPANEKHREKAIRTLRESAAYGVAMFPDADTNSKCRDDDDDDWVMGVGDEIVRERARVRRRELEEEERLEEEMWVQNEGKQAAEEKMSKGKGKAKKVVVEKEQVKGTRKGKEKMKDEGDKVQHISELSDVGVRPRPRPRRVRPEASSADMDSDVPIASDASDAPTRGPKPRGRNKVTHPKHPPIDLCTDSSDNSSGRRQASRQAKAEHACRSSRYATDSDSDAKSIASSTRGSRAKSLAWSSDYELMYPSSPAQVAATRPQHRGSVNISSDDEATPRPGRKVKLVSTASSTNSSTGVTKRLQPLPIARNRRVKDSWKRRMSPNTRGIDDDDDPYSEPDETLKPYLKLERNQDQVRNNVDQSNEHSWLLSSESSAER